MGVGDFLLTEGTEGYFLCCIKWISKQSEMEMKWVRIGKQ